MTCPRPVRHRYRQAFLVAALACIGLPASAAPLGAQRPRQTPTPAAPFTNPLLVPRSEFLSYARGLDYDTVRGAGDEQHLSRLCDSEVRQLLQFELAFFLELAEFLALLVDGSLLLLKVLLPLVDGLELAVEVLFFLIEEGGGSSEEEEDEEQSKEDEDAVLCFSIYCCCWIVSALFFHGCS